MLIFSAGVMLITIRTYPLHESNDEIAKAVDDTCVVNLAQLADPPPVVVVVVALPLVVEEGIMTDLVVREAALAVVREALAVVSRPDELVDVEVEVVEDLTAPM